MTHRGTTSPSRVKTGRAAADPSPGASPDVRDRTAGVPRAARNGGTTVSHDTVQVQAARSAGGGFTRAMIPVAIVAILAAAGMVAVSGASSADDDSVLGRGTGEHETVQSPLIAPKPFHPRTERGNKLAKVSFWFTYRLRTRHKAKVQERIDGIIEVINHETVRAVMGRSPEELRSKEGQIAIERDLVSKLQEIVFQDGLGTIDRILWDQVLVQ